MVDGVPRRGVARGWIAVGGVAAGGIALGGLAVARDYALGGAAIAAHANDELARQYFSDPVFSALHWGLDHSQWLVVLAILPALAALLRRGG